MRQDLDNWLWRLDSIEQEMARLVPASNVHVLFLIAIDFSTKRIPQIGGFGGGELLHIHDRAVPKYTNAMLELWFDLGYGGLPGFPGWGGYASETGALPFVMRIGHDGNWSVGERMPMQFQPENPVGPLISETLMWSKWYYCEVHQADADGEGSLPGLREIEAVDLEKAVLEACALAPPPVVRKIGNLSSLRCWPTALFYLAMKRLHPAIQAFLQFMPPCPWRQTPPDEGTFDSHDLIITLKPDLRTATRYAFDLFRRSVQTKGASADSGIAASIGQGQQSKAPDRAQRWEEKLVSTKQTGPQEPFAADDSQGFPPERDDNAIAELSDGTIPTAGKGVARKGKMKPTRPLREDTITQDSTAEGMGGWDNLKEWNTKEGDSFESLYREVDGRELSIVIDALAQHARKAWKVCKRCYEVSPDDLPDENEFELLSDIMTEAQEFRAGWVNALNHVLHAEQWLYRTLGPARHIDFLDRLADAMWGLLDETSGAHLYTLLLTSNAGQSRPEDRKEARDVAERHRQTRDVLTTSVEALYQLAKELRSLDAGGLPNGTEAGGQIEKGTSGVRERPRLVAPGNEGTGVGPKGPEPAPEGEWSLPMSKIDMRVRLGNMAKDKFETFVVQYELKRINRQLYQIRLDTMDSRTRRRLETGR